MRQWLVQWLAMAVKELRVVLLDKRARTTLVSSPLIQLFLFGMATTLEVTNIDIGVVNRDNGRAAEQVLAGLQGASVVDKIRYYPEVAALNRGIERREILAGIALPPDLSADVAAGRTAQVMALYDGRRINAARVTAGYFDRIVRRAGAEVQPIQPRAGPRLESVSWFNRNLDYRWFTLPGMIAVITTVLVLSVSIQSFAREREFGTIGQLIVLPLTPLQLLLGKMVPAFLVGLVNAVTYAILIPLFFDVPFTGSFALLGLGIVIFAFSIASIGMIVSVLADNQQQAFLGGFLVIVPLILLSGYVSPVDNMPDWLAVVARIDPLQHMVFICQGIFLKDLGWGTVSPHLFAMAAVGFSSISIAYILLRLRRG
ncbi:ABC transporter permease [Alteriqipengyuania flavescens]|uniref:ABC transporter permease n=1 Tax=Alteriqipengyuania flavescens TaxID=3053610 RepID=UPI0025B39278|nr:ABC transporter permease [Alteriqipengyuania flavescens]WJY18456.1 ABC transporter permease [Alteriqipengyuania flavescens]WJY24397.1 ABC transporter permease [Alteriqipengyuania flavescens]